MLSRAEFCVSFVRFDSVRVKLKLSRFTCRGDMKKPGVGGNGSVGPSSTPSAIPPLMSVGSAVVGGGAGPGAGAISSGETLSAIERAKLREQERRRREAVSFFFSFAFWVNVKYRKSTCCEDEKSEPVLFSMREVELLKRMLRYWDTLCSVTIDRSVPHSVRSLGMGVNQSQRCSFYGIRDCVNVFYRTDSTPLDHILLDSAP